MSVRNTVELALTNELLRQRGDLRVHFSHGEPVVTDPRGQRLDPTTYHVARGDAERLYRIVLERVDWHRVALESVAALDALHVTGLATSSSREATFGHSARDSGRALRLALSTDMTFPDWPTEVRADEERRASRRAAT